jgi:hypothetical protein
MLAGVGLVDVFGTLGPQANRRGRHETTKML